MIINKNYSGFRRVIDGISHHIIDVPKAGEYLFKFLVRAVADGCIPQTFITQHPLVCTTGTHGTAASEAIQHAALILSAPHSKSQIDKVISDTLHAKSHDDFGNRIFTHTYLEKVGIIKSSRKEISRNNN